MADLAISSLATYGSYPTARYFNSTDHVVDLSSEEQPAYSAAFDPQDGIKRHAACDECRKRKLKCSGRPDGCTRCVKQKLVCHYSEQKQMGRPRKRQKTGDDEGEEIGVDSSRGLPKRSPRLAQRLSTPPSQRTSLLPVDPILTTSNVEKEDYRSTVRPDLTTATARMQSHRPTQEVPELYSGNSNTTQTGARTPDSFDFLNTQYPTDVAEWPDFSTLDALPLPVENKWQDSVTVQDMNGIFDPDVNPATLSCLPPIPACPCLPNLYLTLSTLSTLSAFPFTQQTVTTLETAFKTAHSVIYCPVCPQKFDTGSSNLMLACTLLNVLADQWNRLRSMDLTVLAKGFGTSEQQDRVLTTKQGQEWGKYAEDLINAYVFGRDSIPKLPGGNVTSETYPVMTLMSLVDALQRRQRQWHRLDDATDEFAARVTPDLIHGHLVGGSETSKGKHLCLEIVNHAKSVIEMLDKPYSHHCHE